MRMVTIGRRGGLTLLALVAVVTGLVLLGVVVAGQRTAPRPPHSVGSIDTAAGAATPTASPVSPDDSSVGGPTPLRASPPVSIAVPAIGVRSRVQPIGLAEDGTLAVPQPGPHLDQAAWFEKSPTPGQPGPAIIEGHVDSDAGPSVFFELGKLRPGNKIHVTRADGVRVTFTVHAIRDYKKSAFPTEVVYGSRHLDRPQLRLITCSDFDASIRHHTGNEVVFADLTSTHRPR
jgi:Sortase domain